MAHASRRRHRGNARPAIVAGCAALAFGFSILMLCCRSVDTTRSVADLANSLKTKLADEDGPVLIGMLARRDLASVQRELLCDTVESCVKSLPSAEAIPAAFPMDLLTDECRNKVEPHLARARQLEKEAEMASGAEKRTKLQDLIEKRVEVASVLEETEYLDLAYLAFLLAHSSEEAFGLAGSEKSVASYALGRFEMRLVENGGDLFRILRSSEVPLFCKERLVKNLRDAASRGDLPSEHRASAPRTVRNM